MCKVCVVPSQKIEVTKLEMMILHVAEDTHIHGHILWFKPQSIKNAIRCRPNAGIYRICGKCGIGNVRHKFNSSATLRNHLIFITWYTRIFEEMHRGDNNFLTERCLVKFFTKLYTALFETRFPTEYKLKAPDRLLKSNSLGDIVRDCTNLGKSHVARVESITVVKIEKGSANSFSDLIEKNVANATTFTSQKKLAHSTMLVKEKVSEFKQELDHYFPYFAGTIDRMARKVYFLVSCYETFRTGGIKDRDLVYMEEFLALKAVCILLQMYFTGRIFASKKWREYLGITAKELAHQRGPRRNKFVNIILTTDANSKEKYITLANPPLDLNLTDPEAYFITEKIPKRFSDFITWRNHVDSLQNAESDIQIKDTMRLSAIYVKLFLSVIQTISKISVSTREKNPRGLLNMDIDIEILSSEEFVSLLLGEAKKGRRYLDDRYYLVQSVLRASKTDLWHPLWKNMLVYSFQEHILSTKQPIMLRNLVAQKDQAVAVVPTILETSEINKHNMEDTDIRNFNMSWEEAIKQLYDKDTRLQAKVKNLLGNTPVYHAINEITISERNELDYNMLGSIVIQKLRHSYFDMDVIKMNTTPEKSKNIILFGNFKFGTYKPPPHFTSYESLYDAVAAHNANNNNSDSDGGVWESMGEIQSKGLSRNKSGKFQKQKTTKRKTDADEKHNNTKKPNMLDEKRTATPIQPVPTNSNKFISTLNCVMGNIDNLGNKSSNLTKKERHTAYIKNLLAVGNHIKQQKDESQLWAYVGLCVQKKPEDLIFAYDSVVQKSKAKKESTSSSLASFSKTT